MNAPVQTLVLKARVTKEMVEAAWDAHAFNTAQLMRHPDLRFDADFMNVKRATEATFNRLFAEWDGEE